MPIRVLLVGLLALGTAGVSLPAETLARRATTIAAILNYPAFFDGQPVLVRAELVREDERASLTDEGDRIPALVNARVGGSGAQEIRGTVWDLGRMRPDDIRLSSHDLRPVLGSDPSAPWPKPGEVVVVNVTDAVPAETLVAPSVRNLALAPERYVEQHVTVEGQFRGRNLYGDLPQAPGGVDASRAFVIRSADAAIWVTGKQPKGRGFNFDVMSRLDTERWVRVSGIVRWEKGLVSIVADDLTEASPQAEAPPEQVTVAPTVIPPEVLFSVPTADETDVGLDTKVRIQFSRDLDTATIKGHVEVSYSSQQSRERGEPEPPPVTARIGYNPGARIMEISFDPPLDRFRIVEVKLTEGITGTDGAPLMPWSLSFTTGGR
jgi:Bacterial Ig-like domain